MADRDFKGVWIPKEIWLDTRLTSLDKVILVEIDSLDNGEKGCFASNEHLADFCQCSLTKVSTSISKLIEFGYVGVASFDGRKRFLKSRLSKSERQPFKNCEADFQKVKDSNTSNKPKNKPDIYMAKTTQSKRKTFVKPTVDEVKEYADSIGFKSLDAQYFFDYYDTADWKRADGSPLVSWKRAVLTWKKKDEEKHPENCKPVEEKQPFDWRDLSPAELLRRQDEEMLKDQQRERIGLFK